MAHGLNEAVPAFRGKAQAEPGHNALGKASSSQVFQPFMAHRAVELAVEVSGGLLVERQELGPFPTAGLVHVPLGELHPGPLGQEADGVHIGQVFQLHHKGDDPPALAAAKAVVELSVRQHVEGGGFLPMEGAQAPVAAPFGCKSDIVGNHIHDVAPCHQLVQKGRWDGHTCHSFPWGSYPFTAQARGMKACPYFSTA